MKRRRQNRSALSELRRRPAILFVVDVSAPQVNFEGVDGTGRVLVAATEGRVVGRRIRSTAPEDVFRNGGSRREVKVTLRRAQAHVAPTDVDVYAGPQWLDASAPPRRRRERSRSRSRRAVRWRYLLRRVFEPCSMDLAFVTKEPVTRVSETTPSGASKDFQGLPRTRPPEALTEFALESPEIEAELTAEQFAALVDVVGSVFLAQYPTDATPPPVAARASSRIQTGAWWTPRTAPAPPSSPRLWPNTRGDVAPERTPRRRSASRDVVDFQKKVQKAFVCAKAACSR